MQKNTENDASFTDEEFDELVPRQRPDEGMHPKNAEKLGNPKLAIATINLTAQDSYNEFAWEFLRRNRFYQAMLDGRKRQVPESKWGYAWHPDVTRTHGLVRLKPYEEAYGDGDPPAWIGLDSFAEMLPTSVGMEFKTVPIDLRPGQIAVVFDVAGLIHGQSPWGVQAWVVRERLKELCKVHFRTTEIFGKPTHKNVLLRRLRMFDLLEKGTPLNTAASELHYRVRKPVAKVKGALSPFSAENMQLKKSEPVTTAFDDANEAYKLVYRHGYLGLLRGEKDYTLQGLRLVPYTIINKSGDEVGEGAL
jgi:hypothetical protein